MSPCVGQTTPVGRYTVSGFLSNHEAVLKVRDLFKSQGRAGDIRKGGKDRNGWILKQVNPSEPY